MGASGNELKNRCNRIDVNPPPLVSPYPLILFGLFLIIVAFRHGPLLLRTWQKAPGSSVSPQNSQVFGGIPPARSSRGVCRIMRIRVPSSRMPNSLTAPSKSDAELITSIHDGKPNMPPGKTRLSKKSTDVLALYGASRSEGRPGWPGHRLLRNAHDRNASLVLMARLCGPVEGG